MMNYFFLIIVKNWETKNNDLRIFDWIIWKSHRSQDFSPHDDRKTFYPIIYEHWKSVLYSSTPTNIVFSRWNSIENVKDECWSSSFFSSSTIWNCFVRMKFQILNTRRKAFEENELSDWILRDRLSTLDFDLIQMGKEKVLLTDSNFSRRWDFVKSLDHDKLFSFSFSSSSRCSLLNSCWRTFVVENPFRFCNKVLKWEMKRRIKIFIREIKRSISIYFKIKTRTKKKRPISLMIKRHFQRSF